MPSTKDVTTADMAAQREALKRVVESSIFSRNPRLTTLLNYLCEKRFSGDLASPKEYAIATDVFGRPPEFDQTTDAIVRVEMHRLRKKLKEYYAAAGAEDPLEIVIHSGHYAPEFIERRPDVPRHAELASDELPIEPSPVRSPTEPSWKPKHRFGLKFWLVATLTVLCCALLLRIALAARKSAAVPRERDSAVVNGQVGIASNEPDVRILCGASNGGKDREGNQWSADSFFSGGEATEGETRPVYRTRDALLFRSMRVGEFSYKIPLKPGVYEMRLFFVDRAFTTASSMEGGEGLRVFDVLLNGAPILKGHDILATVGVDTADIQVFKDVYPASDGYVYLKFVKGQNQPLLNAIEIQPGLAGHMRPIRLVTQETEITDHSGAIWSSDSYFLNGRMAPRYGSVQGSDDPQIYERERYGNFSYAIPVAPGAYELRLHFAETYWGPQNPGGGGEGSRVFDVYCNGTALARDLDIFREVGVNRQLVKDFHGVRPNAQGSLLLSFVPRANYATVSAIEVFDESK